MPVIKNQSDIDSIDKLNVGDTILYAGQTAKMPAGQLLTINLLKLDLGNFTLGLLYEWKKIITVELKIDSHKLINNGFNNIFIYNDTNQDRFITVTVRNVDTSKHSDILHQNNSAVQIYNDYGIYESKKPLGGTIILNSRTTALAFIKDSESSTPINTGSVSPTDNKTRIRVNLPTGKKLYCDLKDI